MLGAEDQRMVVAETIACEPAKAVIAPDRRHEVHRHLVVGGVPGQHRRRAERDDTSPIEIREVLLDLELRLRERKGPIGAIEVLAQASPVESATARTGP